MRVTLGLAVDEAVGRHGEVVVEPLPYVGLEIDRVERTGHRRQPSVSLALTDGEWRVAHAQAGMSPPIAVRRGPAPVLSQEQCEVLGRWAEIVGIQRPQHDVVGDAGVEAVDECNEKRHPPDDLVDRDVPFHVVDTRVVVVRTGDKVDDFELRDETGTTRRLSEFLLDGPVVLFFYPAAMTLGCTKESCHFRDLAAEFKEAGGQRVGISADTVEKQRQFSDKHSFDYPLLADTERTVAEQFGVKRGFGISPTKRSTFVIDTNSTVLAVINSEISMNTHADKALKVLRDHAT